MADALHAGGLDDESARRVAGIGVLVEEMAEHRWEESNGALALRALLTEELRALRETLVTVAV